MSLAASRVGTPQLRNSGTLGGNLLQDSRCPYYRDGWKWMEERYAARASYRYRVMDAAGAVASPLAVWSDTACRDLIIEEEPAESNR